MITTLGHDLPAAIHSLDAALWVLRFVEHPENVKTRQPLRPTYMA